MLVYNYIWIIAIIVKNYINNIRFISRYIIMKKKRWIILICVVLLAVWFAVWFAVWYFYSVYDFSHWDDSYWYDFNPKTGCYKVNCGPMENCEFVFMCPWQPYFREWRRGYEHVDIKNCCDDSVKEGESCWWGGRMRESYDDAYCGKDCCSDSLRGDENCRCNWEVLSSSKECNCIVDDVLFDHIEGETIDTGVNWNEITWENVQKIYLPGVFGSEYGCVINENGEEICWHIFN